MLDVWIVQLALAPAPASPELRWAAPTGCPTASAVEKKVETLLRRRGGASTRVTTDASVSRLGPNHWRLELAVETDAGVRQRTIDAESCKAAGDATALVIAVAAAPFSLALGSSETDIEGEDTELDRDAADSEGDAAGEAGADGSSEEDGEQRGRVEAGEDERAVNAAESTDASSALRRRAKRSKKVRKDRPALNVFARVHGGADVGDLRGVAPVVGALLDVRWPNFGLELGGRYVPPMQYAVEGVNLQMQLATGSLRLGPVFGRGRVVVPVYLGAEAGNHWGGGLGLAENRQASFPWLALGGSVSAQVSLAQRFGVWVGVEGHAVVARPNYVVDREIEAGGSDEDADAGDGQELGEQLLLFEGYPVAGRILAGVSLRLF